MTKPKSLGELLFACTARARHPQWLESREAMARDWQYSAQRTKDDWQRAAVDFVREAGGLIESMKEK